MAPTRIRSQSASVFGSMSTIPALVSVPPTALKMLSATGSIMYFINSLTDTTGVTSPHSVADSEVVRAAGGADFGDEQAAIVALRTISTAAARIARPARIA